MTPAPHNYDCIHFKVCKYSGCSERHCEDYLTSTSDKVVVYKYHMRLPPKSFPSITRRKLALNDIGKDEDDFTRLDFELKNGDVIQVFRQQTKEHP